jgi:hypothetical protein
MEVVLDLCASKEVIHENHARKTWCAHGGALCGANYKNGQRKDILLACDERGHKTFCAHLCKVLEHEIYL